MSQVLINQYLAQLDVLKKVGGTQRESVVREAFKDLLKAGPDWRPCSATPHIAPPHPPEYRAEGAFMCTLSRWRQRAGARVNAWLNHVAHQEAG